MLNKLIQKIPNKMLVKMYKHFPILRVKNWVVYRSQHKFLVGLLGVILNEKGEVLLLKHDYRTVKWGIPGGWLEQENPTDGLIREVFEETGFQIEIEKVFSIKYHLKPKRIEIIMVGRVIGGKFQPSDEITDFQFCHIDKLPHDLPQTQIAILQEYKNKIHLN